MKDAFDFKNWITENKVGPYSKMNPGKKLINESIDEAPVPPAKDDLYADFDIDDRIEQIQSQLDSVLKILRQDQGFSDTEILDLVKYSLATLDEGSEDDLNEDSSDPYYTDDNQFTGPEKYYWIYDVAEFFESGNFPKDLVNSVMNEIGSISADGDRYISYEILTAGAGVPENIIADMEASGVEPRDSI